MSEFKGNTEGQGTRSRVFQDRMFKVEGRVRVKTLVPGQRLAFWRVAERVGQGTVISKDTWSFSG